MNMIYIMLLTLPLQAIKNKTDVQLIWLSKILSASCGLIEIWKDVFQKVAGKFNWENVVSRRTACQGIIWL